MESLFLVARSSGGCSTGSVGGTGQQPELPWHWIHWSEAVALAVPGTNVPLIRSPQAEGASGGAPRGSAGARPIQRPAGSWLFLCTPCGLFSSFLVYFRKLGLFSVTKVPFLLQSPRSRQAPLSLQRSELALPSPGFGASCCPSGTTEGQGPFRCPWVAESDVELSSEGWQ